MYKIVKWTKEITDSGMDETIAKKPPNMPHKFRLLDDDEIVYCYGYSDDNASEAAFAPLDHYMHVYGCTSIQYKNPDTGIYEIL